MAEGGGSSTSGTPLSLVCSDSTGTGIACNNDVVNGGGVITAAALIPKALPALLVGDFTSGIYITPSSLVAGVPALAGGRGRCCTG